MNGSEKLGNDMLATPPERVHNLTQAELKEYGLGGVDPVEQQRRAIANEMREVEEVKRLGLDRQEYVRRKALGDRLCVYTIAGEPVTNDSDFLNCKERVLKTGHR